MKSWTLRNTYGYWKLVLFHAFLWSFPHLMNHQGYEITSADSLWPLPVMVKTKWLVEIGKMMWHQLHLHGWGVQWSEWMCNNRIIPPFSRTVSNLLLGCQRTCWCPVRCVEEQRMRELDEPLGWSENQLWWISLEPPWLRMPQNSKSCLTMSQWSQSHDSWNERERESNSRCKSSTRQWKGFERSTEERKHGIASHCLFPMVTATHHSDGMMPMVGASHEYWTLLVILMG